MLNAALSTSPVPATSVYVKVFAASTSVVLRAPTAALGPAFSEMLEADNTISVGASLTFVTLITNDFSVNNPTGSVDRIRSV